MRSRKTLETNELLGELSKKLVGQPDALQEIVPFIEVAQAGLAPEGRPAGVFLLLGPTGTGKTRTVEVLTDTLHGAEGRYLRIDCGEFQMEHEVAKLIGAPPGYLGHRETQPAITQQKLAAVTSESCDLPIVLFDEIEKAAPTLIRLLLGVLDRGTLTLGDNSTVLFEKCLVFMTSNLGAKEMMRELNPKFGFESCSELSSSEVADKIERVGMAAVRRKFPPEFVNRLDVVLTYKPLDSTALDAILNHQVHNLERHVEKRLGAGAFQLNLDQDSRAFLLAQGTSTEYGARELKRVVHRHLTQPIATCLARGEISRGGVVDVALDEGRSGLAFFPGESSQTRVLPIAAARASSGVNYEAPIRAGAGRSRAV